MQNAVIILIIAVLLGVGIRHIYRSIRYGKTCCGSGKAMDKKVRVKDRNKANYPFSYKLKVEGMVCAGCARNVENAINSVDGLWARVDLEHKEVSVLSKREMDRGDFAGILSKTSYTLMDVV